MNIILIIYFIASISNGAPIFYLNNNKLIGISNIINYNNKSIILKYPIEEFINKYEINYNMNNIINNQMQMQNMNMNNMQNPNMISYNEAWLEGFRKGVEEVNNEEFLSCPKMNVLFKACTGRETMLVVDLGTTIDELLMQYLAFINMIDYGFENRMDFSFGVRKLRFGDKTKIELFFKNAPIPNVVVTGDFYCFLDDDNPIKKVTFKTTLGIIHQLRINFHMKIKELFKYYLHLVKRPESLTDKNSKIFFLYNAKKIKLDDRTLLDKFFSEDLNPIIIVNDPEGLIINDKK